MAQTITTVLTIAAPAVTGTFTQADGDAKSRAYAQEVQNAIGPSYVVTLTSQTLS